MYYYHTRRFIHNNIKLVSWMLIITCFCLLFFRFVIFRKPLIFHGLNSPSLVNSYPRNKSLLRSSPPCPPITSDQLTNPLINSTKLLLSPNPSPSYLQSKQKFEATLKSCLGSYCLDKPFEIEGKKKIRIGILFPDEILLNQFKPIFQDVIRGDEHVVYFSTHVPPYGYGRNHGLSKIIRFAEDLTSQSIRMLNNLNVSQYYTKTQYPLVYETQVISTILCILF